MIATVGPMTTAGINLETQFVPQNLQTNAKITYTKPAKTAPMMRPMKPMLKEAAPAKAANILPKKANELPKKTGDFDFVKSK